MPESGGTLENKFRINIKGARFKEDNSPVDSNCKCYTCRNYTRAYLSHLYRAGERTYAEEQGKITELTYFRLATIHNMHYILNLMQEIRKSIADGKFGELKRK